MERFDTKYVIVERGFGTPCWIWIASKDKWGYGRFRLKGRTALAHRVSWELKNGSLPDYPSQELDHLCGNRECVNPDHLEAVSQKVNTLRSTSFSAVNAGKTACKAGHFYSQGNTYIRPNGTRDCRACIRERVRAYKERRRATA